MAKDLKQPSLYGSQVIWDGKVYGASLGGKVLTTTKSLSATGPDINYSADDLGIGNHVDDYGDNGYITLDSVLIGDTSSSGVTVVAVVNVADVTFSAAGQYPGIVTVVPSLGYYGGWNLTYEKSNAAGNYENIYFRAGNSATQLTSGGEYGAPTSSDTELASAKQAVIVAGWDDATMYLYIRYIGGTYDGIRKYQSNAHSPAWAEGPYLNQIGGYLRSETYRSYEGKIYFAASLEGWAGEGLARELLEDPYRIVIPADTSPLLLGSEPLENIEGTLSSTLSAIVADFTGTNTAPAGSSTTGYHPHQDVYVKSQRGWPIDPREKPKIELEVDWNNSITNGLRSAFLFDNPHHVNDLARGISLDYNVESRQTLETVLSEGNELIGRVYYAGSALHDDFTLNELLHKPTRGLTYAVGALRNSADSTRTFNVLWGDGANYKQAGISSSNTFRMSTANAADTLRFRATIPFSASDGYSQIAMSLANPGGTLTSKGWKNGQEVTTTDSITSIGNNDMEARPTTSVLYGDGYSGAGWLSHLFVWERALTDSEMEVITTNPFSILKPTNQLPYFIEVEVASMAPVLSAAGVTNIGINSITPRVTLTF